MKRLKFIGMAAFAVALCGGFSSCSDDDDDNGGSVPTGPTATFSGKLLSQIGRYTFSYDENGRCVEVSHPSGDDGASEIDYSTGTITTDYGDTYNVTFNGKGYITSLYGAWDYIEDGESSSGSGRISFSYDGNGHLIGVTSSGSSTEVYEGERYSYSESGKAVLTWQDGNLIKTEQTVTENDGGEKITEVVRSSFEYGNQANPTGQYCVALENNFLDLELSVYSHIGLFGVGPAYFPTSYSYYENYDGEEHTDNGNCSYTLNSDGTINRETVGGINYNYSYITFGTSAAKVAYTKQTRSAGSQNVAVGKKVREMFMPMHTRRNVPRIADK